MPWLVHWPAKVVPGVSDAIISQVDLFATLATLAGSTSLPDKVTRDSMDLSESLCGNQPIGRDHVVEHSGAAGQLAIRRGK